MQEIYINNEKLDMFPGQEIGLTIQFTDVREVQTRRGNVSNVFSIPLTPKNIRLLGYVNQPASVKNYFKRVFACDYFENGTAVINGGNLKVLSTTEKEIKVRINSGNTSFFNLISETLNVGHLFCTNYSALLRGDFSPLLFDPEYMYFEFPEVNKDWTQSTERIIYPIINYRTGNIAIYSPSPSSINIGNLMPSIKAKAILDRFTVLYGYSFHGPFLSTPEFNNLALIPDTLNQLDLMLQENDPTFGPVNTFDFLLNAPKNNEIITVTAGNDDFDTGYIQPINPINPFTLSTPSLNLYDGTNVPVTVYGELNFNAIGTVEVRFGTSLAKKDMYFDLEILERNPSTSADRILKTIRIIDFKKKYNNDLLDYNYSDSYTGWLRYDRRYYGRIKYSIEGVGLSSSFQVELTGRFEQSFNLNTTKTTTNMVHFPYLMFQTKQTAFFKELINTYGLLMTTNEFTKEVHFNKFEDIKKRLPDAYELNIDLTKGFEILPSDSVGGQRSHFKFSFDEIGIEGINDGYITINNKDLPEDADALQMQYGSITEVTEGPYTFGKFPVEDIDKTSILPRFVQLESMENTAFVLSNLFAQTNALNYNPCKGRVYGSYPLTFNSDFTTSNLITNHYDLYARMIENSLTLNVYAYIDAIDVQKFDITRPVHIRSTDNVYNLNSYYIISKIDKFTTGINQITLQKINL